MLTYYPDSGPLRRELYPRHLEFFAAGAKYRERLMLAANRCITPWSVFETDRGERQALELIGETGFYVRSWDGSSPCTKRAEPLFLKCIEPAFQIHLDNGQAFQVSGKHQVLADVGTGGHRLGVWLTIDQLIHASNVRRYSRTAQGWKASYGADDRLCGESHPSVAITDGALLPTQHDAPTDIPYCSHEDAGASTPGYSRACPAFALPPSTDARHLLADLCGKISAPAALRFSLPSFWKDQTSRRSLCECDLLQVDQLVEAALDSLPPIDLSHILLAFDSPVLMLGSRIIAVVELGLQPIIDTHVPETGNYIMAGCVNHNTGKTEGVGGYELALHLTGNYPEWWNGRRFQHPVSAWAAGDTSKTVRDIIQRKLLGAIGSWGTGLIPGDSIARIVRGGGGLADSVDTVYCKHASGGSSQLTLKTYEQRREAFQGTEQDIIWLDEEPDLGIYTECLLRTMTNNGMVMLTFTPLLGMSEVVLSFLPGGRLDSAIERAQDATKYVVMATWDDAPHLDPQAKKDLWNSIPPFQRDARSKGIPQLGAGAIYPVPETDLLVDPFAIPAHWPQGYGMDVGWNCTAAVWGALDRQNDILYLTGEHRRSQAEPSVNAAGIRARGEWIPGFIDPASRGRGQRDGEQLFHDYVHLGLKLSIADNGVESGLYSVWNRMSTGRLKVFKSMTNWLQEFRLYRRDEKGHVVKANDHLQDATRYLESRVMSMIVKPPIKPLNSRPSTATAWS